MPLLGRKKVDKMIEKEYIELNNKVRAVFFKGAAQIKKGTPVDTGRARGNWFFQDGTPSGKGSLNRMPKFIFNKKLYLFNNLPYITKLEYGGFTNKEETEKTIGGFSKQVKPNGWVRKTLIEMRNAIRKL